MRWLVIPLLLIMVGCARPPEPLWTDLPTPEQLLARLSARSGQTAGLDMEAAASITNAGRHLSSQQFLLVQPPDRMRVDVLTGFGQLILQLATDGDILTVLLNTTVPPRFFSGEASDENFSRFVRLPLPASLLVPLLLHDPPVMRYQEQQVELNNNQLTLVLVNQEVRQNFYFDGQWQLIGMDYFQGEMPVLSVRYSRFSTRDNFPRSIEMELPQEDARLVLRINDLALDPEIPLEKFRLQPPDNIIVEPLL